MRRITKNLLLLCMCSMIIFVASACSLLTADSRPREGNGRDFSVRTVSGAMVTDKSDGTMITDLSGNLIGSFNVNNETLTIDICETVPQLKELDSIKKRLPNVKTIIVEGAVKTISSDAFNGFNELLTVTIGGNVETIGNDAFYGCVKLRDVTMGDSVREIGSNAFYGCEKLRNVYLGDGVQTIGSNAFAGCRALAEITLGSHVQNVPATTFADCSALRTFITGSDIPADLFRGNTVLETVVMKDTVSSLEKNAFSDCTALKTVEFSENLKRIGERAFSGCTSLNSVNIQTRQNLTIEDNAFAGCKKLQRVFIGGTEEGLGITLGGNCFSLCEDLTGGVVFGEGVTRLGEYLFNRCENLRKIVLPKSLQTIGTHYLNGTKLDFIYFCGTQEEWYKLTHNNGATRFESEWDQGTENGHYEPSGGKYKPTSITNMFEYTGE